MYSIFRHSMSCHQHWKVQKTPTWPLRTWASLHSHPPLSYLHRAEATRKQRRRCHGVPGLEILMDCTHQSTCKAFLKLSYVKTCVTFISVPLHKETYEYVWKEIFQILFSKVDCKHHLKPNQNTPSATTSQIHCMHCTCTTPQNMSPVSKVSGSISESLSKKHWDTTVSVDGCSEFPSHSSKQQCPHGKWLGTGNLLQKHSFAWLLG